MALKFAHYVKWVDAPSSFLSNDGLRQAISAVNGQAKEELETALQDMSEKYDENKILMVDDAIVLF